MNTSSPFWRPELTRRSTLRGSVGRHVALLLGGVCAVLAGCGPSAEGAAVTTGGTAAGRPTTDVPEIVERAFEHHGSELLEEARVSLTVSSQSGSFDVVAEPGPVFDYVVRRGEGEDLLERRHTNKPEEPEASETRGSGEVRVLDGRAAQVVRDYVSARVYFLFFPYRLQDPNTYLRDLGLESWGGKSLHKVELSFEPGTSTNAKEKFLFWFEPDRAELVQFAYSFDGGIRFRKLIDPRRVGGVLFASQENYAHDGNVTVDVITPDFAADMDLLSVVELRDIEVTPR